MSNVILAIDTSTDHCSIAIYKKKRIYFLLEKCKKQHTLKVLPMLQKILLQTKITLRELKYIAFAKGPGNFTSIRIAASIAQSFSLSLNIPIISVSTLLIMAQKTWRIYNKKNIIVAMWAKTTHVYWAEYERNQDSFWIGEETESLLKKELIQDKIANTQKKWTLVGNGWQLIENTNILNINRLNIFFPEAQDIIPFVLLKIKNKNISFYQHSNINYLYNEF